MKKNFVFDTNVLLNDPYAINRFDENNVIIPITVIEELDKFKRDLNTVGRNAREAARTIDGYRDCGNLYKGVKLPGGGLLRVITDLGKEPPLPFPTLGKTADSLILATALLLKKHEELPVVFVTRDINLRIRADAVGLTAVNYEEKDAVRTVEELYSGHTEVKAPSDVISSFTSSGKGKIDAQDYELLPNQCVTLVDVQDENNRAYGRRHHESGKIKALIASDKEFWGISARNAEQHFALDLLADDSVQIVTMAGKAGTGKTLLAIAAGLNKTMDERKYAKLVVARPIMPLGKELGFLPGEVSEKINPWMQPVYDNLELIMASADADLEMAGTSKKGRKKTKKPLGEGVRNLMDTGLLEVEALTYIRGRSLPRQYLIIDEAQNLTHHEVKTIITRVGENTKIVLTGDIYQIDSPFLDSRTSGLTIAVEKFKGQDIAGHITLVKGERSPLAELASNIL